MMMDDKWIPLFSTQCQIHFCVIRVQRKWRSIFYGLMVPCLHTSFLWH